MQIKIQIESAPAMSAQKQRAQPRAGPLKVAPQSQVAEVIKLIPAVTSIQKYARRFLAMRRMKALSEKKLQHVRERKKDSNPNETAIKEFVTQLGAKGLKPEEFFRILDRTYQKRVTKEAFLDRMEKMKLVLLVSQKQRLLYLFDEDLSGEISLTEFQQALEAYSVAKETHVVGPGPRGEGYVKYELLVLERLTDLMETQDLEPDDLYDALDTDGSGEVSLKEFVDTLQSIDQAMMKKDLQMIENYFRKIDSNGNGVLSRQEFVSQLARALKVTEKRRQSEQAAEEDDEAEEFGEVNIEAGDEAFFQDAFDTMKGWFGGKKKKQTFAKLDPLIPGYSQMSPRTKCDAAVTCLIKEMKKNGVKAGRVFSLADHARTKKATVLALKEAFLKLCPKIDGGLIADALQSFGTDEKKVEEAVFLTNFNEQFDSDLNQKKAASPAKRPSKKVPPSKQQAGKKPTAASERNSQAKPASKAQAQAQAQTKPARPATASMVVAPTQKANQSLIRKLDNVLLKQKINHTQAFHSADVNGDGKITMIELRNQLKQLLDDSAFTPADFKMTMLAFDRNKDGLITLDEYIACFEEARAAANPPSAPTSPLSSTQQQVKLPPNRVQRPQTASPAGTSSLRPQDASLISKLKDALRSQNVSPEDAFAQADLNGNGIITYDELKKHLQRVLSPDKLSPMELAKTMKAMDQNRNGSISLEEYSKIFMEASKAKLAPQAAGNLRIQSPINSENQPFQATDLSAIDRMGTLENSLSECNDTTSLVLKVLFADMLLVPAALQSLAERNLSILEAYWAKTELLGDQDDFIEHYSKENTTLLEREAIVLHQALEDNLQQTVQPALNKVFSALRLDTCKLTPALISELKKVKMDVAGLVSDAQVKKLFMSVHQSDRSLFTKFAQLYQEVVGEDSECSFRQFQMIFSKVEFTKTLLLSAETLKEKQEGTNFLALVTGVWLVEADTLYRDSKYTADWKELLFRYLATLYDAMDASASTADIHSSMAKNTKMLQNKKQNTLRRWIQFLDNNRLRAVSSQNQKCLYMTRQERQVLPPAMDEPHGFAEMLALIETCIKPFRTGKPVSEELVSGTAPQKGGKQVTISDEFPEDGATTSQISLTKPAPLKSSLKSPSQGPRRYLSERENDVVRQLEEMLEAPIQTVLLEFAEQQVVPPNQLLRAFRAKNKRTPKDLVASLLKECGEDGNISQVQVGDLVRKMLGEQQERDKVNETLRTIAASVDQNVRETLTKKIFADCDEFITKDRFLEAFGEHGLSFGRWDLLCLFYYLDAEDGIDEEIKMETIVKLVSDLKGVKYAAPGEPLAQADQSMPPISSAKAMFNQQKAKSAGQAAAASKAASPPVKAKPLSGSAATIANEARKVQAKVLGNAKAMFSLDQMLEDVLSQTGSDVQIYPDGTSEEEAERVLDIEWDNFSVEDAVITKALTNLVKLHKCLMKPSLIESLFAKILDWGDTLEGDESEATVMFVIKAIQEALKKHKENAILDEANAFMVRYAYSQIKNKTGTRKFSIFELQALFILAVERDGFNEFETDNEFLLKFYKYGELEEDEQAELKEECMERLRTRVYLAALVLKEINACSGEELKISEDSVWQKCRFSRIVRMIIDALVEPAKKALFVQAFKEGVEDKLTYYEFKQLIKGDLGVTQVLDWMYEDFESALDPMGQAFIQLNEVITFFQAFGYDLQVQALAPDSEAALAKKLNVIPKNYVLSDKDYYRGIQSILNSEVAALKRCQEIWGSLPDEGKFLDTDFGPKDANDAKGSAESLYFGGKTPQSHLPAEQIEWLRPEEYNEDGQKGVFIDNDASSNEVKQGRIGDCWFIGALSVLATRDELLRGGAEYVPPDLVQLINNEQAQLLSMGVYPPIFHKFRFKHIYVLRFFKGQQWRYVVIDDRLPVNKFDSRLVFGSCSNQNELWVPLIEKAYAKLHGCYQTLISGFIDDGLADLTAMVCEKKMLHNKNGEFEQSKKEQLWEYLQTMKENGCLMGCSVSGGIERTKIIDGENSGIMSGHAYSLNDVFEIDDEAMENPRKTHRLLRIRNPWGRGEWMLKWSDLSDEIDEHEDKINEYISRLEDDEKFEIGASDGTFLINYASWRDIYNKLFVVNDFPDDWSAVRFKSEWTSATSGGLPMRKTLAEKKQFAKNPQFLFMPEEDCEVFISLQQNDGREKGDDGSYSKYPFKDRILGSMLFVFQLAPGQERLEEYDKPKPLTIGKPIVLHEISVRLKLKANERYLVVPSTRKAGDTGKFSLSFYTDLSMNEFDLKRLDDYTCMYQFILEEYAKSERRVPKWKIKLAQNNIQFMIRRTDNIADLSLKKIQGLDQTVNSGPAAPVKAKKSAVAKRKSNTAKAKALKQQKTMAAQ